jgi:hypothetical protein
VFLDKFNYVARAYTKTGSVLEIESAVADDYENWYKDRRCNDEEWARLAGKRYTGTDTDDYPESFPVHMHQIG